LYGSQCDVGGTVYFCGVRIGSAVGDVDEGEEGETLAFEEETSCERIEEQGKGGHER
jgi:hypothetical protein